MSALKVALFCLLLSGCYYGVPTVPTIGKSPPEPSCVVDNNEQEHLEPTCLEPIHVLYFFIFVICVFACFTWALSQPPDVPW